ncbi:MAG: NAD-dependent epimerase/dehydratase family protein [Terriglobales bacterium]
MADILILGCGYTGQRVAARLLARGLPVTVTTRHPESLAELAAAGARVVELDLLREDDWTQLDQLVVPGTRLLHSLPVLRTAGGERVEITPRLMARLAAGRRVARVVYLSTTGVYGDATQVDARSHAVPVDAIGRLRVAAEQAVMAGPWRALVLRAAAIYGPGRGVFAGEPLPAGAGQHVVSRIHVDDLAAHAEAGLLGEVTGAFPVADELPAPTLELALYRARLRGEPPPAAESAAGGRTRRPSPGRRVDGSAIRAALGIKLQYRTYREAFGRKA